MLRRCLWGLLGLVVLAGCAGDPAVRQSYQNPSLNAFTSDRFETFGSQAAFERYLRGVRKIADVEEARRSMPQPVLLAQAAVTDPETLTDVCPADECPEDLAELSDVTVTASKASNPVITNNQEAGVDEGDIIKQIDDFLIVLQDGRLFSVNLKPAGAEGLELSGRQNVYWSDMVDTWYDEMLVSGRRIVVTGYSYEAEASEISILTLNEDGSFTHEDTFYIASDDYYDTDNYATRIIGDKFIVHTPIYLTDYDSVDALPWPVVRHLGGNFEAAEDDEWDALPSSPLLKVKDIYRPLQNTIAPVVHMVSICDIGGHRTGEMMACEATAFVAPEGYEFYVSPTDVFLWTWPSADEWKTDFLACDERSRVARYQALPATIFKIPVNGRPPEAVHVTGRPFDQFSMVEDKFTFRALIDWTDPVCDGTSETFYPALLSVPMRAFSEAPDFRRAGRVHELPEFSFDLTLENRFVGQRLVYSTSDGSGHYPPRKGERSDPARVTIVPVRAPARSQTLSVPHSVIRLERLGEDAVVTGYTDDRGLHVSTLALGRTSEIGSTAMLENRFESEGRSHAFNSVLDADNGGLMGIPTVARPDGAGRWWWNSESSDVSFLTVDGSVQIKSVGPLLASEADEHETYECEVSCVDWYGNSRPVFTDARVFALSGTELIEGEIVDGVIRERRRVNLTAPVRAQGPAG